MRSAPLILGKGFRRAALLASVLPGLAAGRTPESGAEFRGGARVEPVLERVLAGPLADGGVALRISLADADLPPPGGAARRAAVHARQQRVLDTLAADAFRLQWRYESLSGFAGFATPAAVAALRRHPEVESIHLDGPVYASLAEGGGLVGASAAHALGYTGAGVNVAVLDTGIDTNHPDLADDLVAERCFCDAHPSPVLGACCPGGGFTGSGPGSAEDDNGHGTNVSGVITSSGSVAPLGVAPDAGIVAVKVLSAAGGGQDSSIDMALDWVLTNHVALGIRVVNLSLGDGGEYNDPTSPPCAGDPTATAIAALSVAGVAVFAASGNEGHDDGIASPACVAEAISVGGVYDASLGNVGWCGNRVCTQALCTDATGPDVFVCHSNSDEILDLLAPDWQTTTSALGGGAASFGGTSAAAPYAAAQGALLLEADPALSPAAIRDLLGAHGPLVVNPDNGLAFRRSDVAAALATLVPNPVPSLGPVGMALLAVALFAIAATRLNRSWRAGARRSPLS